jgi:hypothetical protein
MSRVIQPPSSRLRIKPGLAWLFEPKQLEAPNFELSVEPRQDAPALSLDQQPSAALVLAAMPLWR